MSASRIGRDEIVNQLRQVTGINPSSVASTTIQPYDAWPVWIQAQPRTYSGLEHIWHVCVVLPNADYLSTIDATDPLIDALTAALLDIADIELIEPDVISLNESSVPILRFRISTVT